MQNLRRSEFVALRCNFFIEIVCYGHGEDLYKLEFVLLKPVFIVIFPYKRVRRFCCIHENRTFYKRISPFHFRD